MIVTKVLKEKQRFRGMKDKLVLQCQSDIRFDVLVSEDEEAPIEAGMTYAFFGRYKQHPRWGRQFHADTYGTLEQAGSMTQVMDLCDGMRFPRDISKQAVLAWGQLAYATITADPYELMRFPRVGFKIADNLYQKLGLPLDAIKRQVLCGVYALETAWDGSTWHLRQVFDDAILAAISGTNPDPTKALYEGETMGLLCREWTDCPEGDMDALGDTEWVAARNHHDDEITIAECVAEAMSERNGWPIFSLAGLSDHQDRELKRATCGNIGLLLGGGGVGKTFVIAKAINQLITSKSTSIDRLMLVAPTGRAAVRLTEEIRKASSYLSEEKFRARTIHSALGWQPGGFSHNREDPLPADFIIVDEASMIDSSIMACLLSARRPGCPILFVGDPYQLPPVAPGAPLRDFVEVVPNKGTLTETRRNSGTITRVAMCVRRGEDFAKAMDTDWSTGFNLTADVPRNYVHIESSGAEKQLHKLDEVIDWFVREHDVDPIWDLQVLGLVNRKSELSVTQVSEWMQRKLNPASPIKGSPFRVDDKVINSSNGWLLPDNGYCVKHDIQAAYGQDAITNAGAQVYVANGEMGTVLRVESNYMTVKMSDPMRIVMVPRGTVEEGSDIGETACRFQLGYCITAHKSQGSQFPYVICMIDESAGARWLGDRSLWYTMLTRSQLGCVTIGKRNTIVHASGRSAIDDRKTFLVQRMKEAIFKCCAGS